MVAFVKAVIAIDIIDNIDVGESWIFVVQQVIDRQFLEILF